MHFDFEFAVALAAFAATTFGVEREAGFFVAALFGEGELGEKIAYEIEGSNEGGGI